MRKTLLHDDVDELHCGIGTDLLLSLLASYRYMKVIPKGSISREELCAELSRDLVTIDPPMDDPREKRTFRICEQLVASLDTWVLLRRSFSAACDGKPSEWDCGPLHCNIQFANKASFEGVVAETFTQYVFMELFRVKGYREPLALSTLRSTVSAVDMQATVDSFDAESPFWFLRHDKGVPSCVPSSLQRFTVAVCEFCAKCGATEWDDAVGVCIRRLYGRIPDVARLLRTRTPSFDFFQQALRRINLSFTVDTLVGSNKCLTAPTMWCKNSKGAVKGLLTVSSRTWG